MRYQMLVLEGERETERGEREREREREKSFLLRLKYDSSMRDRKSV
jgi:hypothetical protein